MKNTLILVSGNKNKSGEVQRILGFPIILLNFDIDEIQEMDPRKIVLHKVNEAFKLTKKPVIVDDVSFEVDVWNGFPGPLIKWLLESKNDPTLMLRMLKNEKNRKAKASLYVGYHDGKKAHIFVGSVSGTISKQIKGDNGFGWDKVFIPNGYDITFAQMKPDIKDSISHRGRALAKLKKFLNSQNLKKEI